MLATLTVNTASDTVVPTDPTLSLREAIEVSNGTLAISVLSTQAQAQINGALSTPNTIDFNIPASTAPGLDIPVPGFDPSTQDWTITLSRPLPAITSPVTIDGFSQGGVPVPYVYPLGGFFQTLTISGNPTGGTFTLTTSTPLPVATTGPLPYNATANQIGAALQGIVGVGNVTVSAGVVPNTIVITFEGLFAGEAIPLLVATSSLTGGTSPSAVVSGTPVEITSKPNSVQALDGNDAQARVIIDGSQIDTAAFPDPPGLVLDASHSALRGLIIDGFDVGVSVPQFDSSGSPISGDLIQGNYIGKYLEYPVDPSTGAALGSPNNVKLTGLGNTQGVVLYASNTTVGGTNPQEDNVISGNAEQGVLIQAPATGNVVEGNQVGIVGPSLNNLYFHAGNGAEGVLDYGSSNQIGGPVAAAGNLISANQSYGVRISGTVATLTVVAANIIGLGPGGGYVFGTGNPGNGDYGDGIRIEDSAQNQIGGPTSAWGNTISSNFGAGVYITGASAMGNTILNNLIGTTSDGTAAQGNAQEGVANYSPGTAIGPGNVISGNLRGVLISGASATGVVVHGNLIGTDITGTLDLGNAKEGVLIDNASGNSVTGNAGGSQVISGNLVGVAITSSSGALAPSSLNLVAGNLIGTDKSGLYALPNAQEGVLIDNASGTTIGGTTAAAQNLISGNEWGVRLDGALATGNLVAGNLIGTDITGKAPLGNEVNGVIITTNASNNTIGGTVSGAGNTIAFNALAGVSVVSGTGDSILSNSIFSNGKLGIDLVAPGDPPDGVTPNAPGVRSGPNDLQNYPILTRAVGVETNNSVLGSLNSIPNTTFLIQFFTSVVPDPSGYGQGQTLIGSMTVTTDVNGNAQVDFTPSTNLSANIWITATATNMSTGDTSEFSNAVSAAPVSVEFQTSSIMVDASDGVAIIHVERVGNSNAIVGVNYATSNGTAVAGQDYTAASGTLVFLAGVMDQTFSVTILPNPSQTTSSVTVNLALSQPTGGATLGTISTATLTINNNVPPMVQFASSAYTTYFTVSSTTVTVSRGGGSRGTTVQVHYATAGGTASPGVDYTPVSGTLTFLPNQTSASFTVPILHAGSTTASKTVGLVLSDPTEGAELETRSTATLTIMASSPFNPVGPVGPPPQVTGEQLILGATGITAVVFSFSLPLNPTSATDLGNYGYYVNSTGPDGVFGTSDDSATPLAAAQYNPANNTVALVPATPLPFNAFERITINALANPLLGRGLTSTTGVLLSGLGNGVPGSPYVTNFGVGTSLTYADSSGKTVYLSLTKGGLIEVFRAPNGDVQSMTLVGAIPRRSILNLHANNAGGRYTYFPPVQGATGVKFRYRTPPIVFRSTPVAPAKRKVAAKPRVVAKPKVVVTSKK
ncbi:MAG: beta strand repeat-containing protein [Isosphaeraceae bacterium]